MRGRGHPALAALTLRGAPLGRVARWLDWPRWARSVAAAAYLAGLTAVLLAPPSAFTEVDRIIPFEDKVAHLGLFLVLAALARWSLPRHGGGRRHPAMLVALALYAGAIEALQPSLTGGQRTFEWTDLACNAAGLAAGWVLPWVGAR